MKKKLIDDIWIREIYRDGIREYTFCGALEYRYNHIAKNWNADTRKKHEREYNNIILPALKDHNEKSIREYTKEDYEEAIEYIRDNGYIQEGVRRKYAESSIHNFGNLIYYVVFQSSVYGLCEDVLWGTKFVLDVPDEVEEIESRVKLKKSLSIEQEKNLASEILNDVDEDGAIIALLLMWGLGLRNAEACGLNYGDIKQIEGHEECYAARIYKTTKIDSNILQSGGKTYNTGRMVPVPEKIIEFLDKRKTLIKRFANEQEMTISIDELPICCDGWIEADSDNFIRRCSAHRVSMVAHEIFERAKITSEQLAYLDVELSEDNTAAVLKEKEPTAYLLRRNYATQMSILGLSVSEMQYLIGHDVEDAYESRNEYVDSERIYEMYQKLEKRALLNEKTDEKTKICISGIKTAKIHISAKEPTDSLNVVFTTKDHSTSVITRLSEESVPITPNRSVDISYKYNKLYQY